MVLAIVVGLFANRTVTHAMEKTPILVAKHDIQPYTQITAKDVEKVTRPASGVPEHAATTYSQVTGTYTKTLIVKGSPIQKKQLALEENGDLSSLLTSFDNPDIRAFALPSQNPMIAKMTPGDRVDLYVEPQDKDETESVMLASKVLVLGLAKDSDDKTVGLILALDEKQIQHIVPVMNNIQITLVPYNAKVDLGKTAEKQGDEKSDDKGGNMIDSDSVSDEESHDRGDE